MPIRLKVEDCLLCEGTGKVKFPHKTDNCPMCEGTGVTDKDKKDRFFRMMSKKKGMYR